MSDEYTRFKRSQKIKKRNLVHKEMREKTGAFAIRTINPRKTEYKRVKLNPRNIDEQETSEEN